MGADSEDHDGWSRLRIRASRQPPAALRHSRRGVGRRIRTPRAGVTDAVVPGGAAVPRRRAQGPGADMSRYPSPERTSALGSARDDLRAPADRPPRGRLGVHLGAGPRRRHAARGPGALLRPHRLVPRPRGLLPRGARRPGGPGALRCPHPAAVARHRRGRAPARSSRTAASSSATPRSWSPTSSTPRCRCSLPTSPLSAVPGSPRWSRGGSTPLARRSRPRRSPCWSVPTRPRSTRCSESAPA